MSVLLAALMLMSVISISAFAADTSVKNTGGNISYSVNGQTLTVSCSEAPAEIPDYDYYNEDTPWYDYYETVTTLIIDEGITRIGDDAFRGFSALTSISLPSTLLSIGSGAFSRCDSLTSINIPANVEDVSGYAFDYD